MFITMEDEDGLMSVIVRPEVQHGYYDVLSEGFRLIGKPAMHRQRVSGKPSPSVAYERLPRSMREEMAE